MLGGGGEEQEVEKYRNYKYLWQQQQLLELRWLDLVVGAQKLNTSRCFPSHHQCCQWHHAIITLNIEKQPGEDLGPWGLQLL